MARYFTRPVGWYDEPPTVVLPVPTVYPSEPVKTGLLTEDGQEIYKGPDVIGFIRKPPASSDTGGQSS